MLDRLENHLPENIRTIPNVNKFLTILQSLRSSIDQELFKYNRNFDPFTTDLLTQLRKFVDDFGGEYLISTQRKTLECLYRNKNYCYSRKGTKEALATILNCYLQQFNSEVSIIDYNSGYPLISFFSLSLGILPEGQDIDDELSGSFTPPKYVPTLLDDSWSLYYKHITVTITSAVDITSEALALLYYVIFLFSPMLENLDVITIETLEGIIEFGGDQVLVLYPELMDGGFNTSLKTYNVVQNGGSNTI